MSTPSNDHYCGHVVIARVNSLSSYAAFAAVGNRTPIASHVAQIRAIPNTLFEGNLKVLLLETRVSQTGKTTRSGLLDLSAYLVSLANNPDYGVLLAG